MRGAATSYAKRDVEQGRSPPRQQAFPEAHPVAGLRGLLPYDWEIGLLWLSVAIGFVLSWSGAGLVGSVALPLALVLIMGAANWRAARSDPAALWTTLFAFRLGNGLFGGVGSLVPFMVDQSQLDRIYGLYFYSDGEAAKFAALWMLYVATALTSARIAYSVLPMPRASWTGKRIEWLNSSLLGIMFFFFGFSYAVLIDLGFALGWYNFVVPGTVSTIFQAINAVGIFLLTLVALERRGFWLIGLLLAISSTLFLGVVLFNKSAILFPVLLVTLALLVRKVTPVRAVVGAGAFFAALTVLQPAVEHARIRHQTVYGAGDGGTVPGGSVLERTERFASYWTEGPDPDVELGSGITRLSYVNIGSFLMAEYDLRIGGETMSGAAIALIPRVIWPDKPITTNVGLDLNERIFGTATSYIAPTTAGDIYWNFGWWGILLLAMPVGVVLWLSTILCREIIYRQDWFMMPFVLVAFRTALSVDQGFVVGVFVPTVFAAILFIALKSVKRVLF